jgi:spore maturation protein CgeB
MLMSERMPIEIPHNFVDGESAVFFENTSELLDKHDYYRAHPAESQRIAEAGYRQLRQFHSGSARARQLLARVASVLSATGRVRIH